MARDRFDEMAGGFIGPLSLVVPMTLEHMTAARDELAALLRRVDAERLPGVCGGCVHSWLGKSYGDGDPVHDECRHPSRADLAVVDGDEAPPSDCPLRIGTQPATDDTRDLPALLDELRAVVAAATPGPWADDDSAVVEQSGEHSGSMIVDAYGSPRECAANARAIAALRNLAPELIVLVQAAQRMRTSYGVSDSIVTALDALTARLREVLPRGER